MRAVSCLPSGWNMTPPTVCAQPVLGQRTHCIFTCATPLSTSPPRISCCSSLSGASNTPETDRRAGVHYLRRIEDSGRLGEAPSTVGAGMHLNQWDEGIAPGTSASAAVCRAIATGSATPRCRWPTSPRALPDADQVGSPDDRGKSSGLTLLIGTVQDRVTAGTSCQENISDGARFVHPVTVQLLRVILVNGMHCRTSDFTHPAGHDRKPRPPIVTQCHHVKHFCRFCVLEWGVNL